MSKFASWRLGKSSVDDIHRLNSLSVGIQKDLPRFNVKCTQVPQDFDRGTYVFVWLGSDNNKGIQTQWKQGFKAIGKLVHINRAEKFNEESTSVIEIVYVFPEVFNRIDILREAPNPYYRCSSLPIIGIDDHSNQTIRLFSETEERCDITAFFEVIRLLISSFSQDAIKIDSSWSQYLTYKDRNVKGQIENMVNAHSKQPLQQIFYGAPGTGKSFAIDNLTNDENTVRTTFHPDSDYASFVGAYKPTMEDVPINSIYGESVQYATGKNGHPGTEKKIVYKYVPQAFLKAYVAAWSDLDNPHYLVIEEINRGNCAQIFGDLFQLLDRNSQGSSSYAIHADDDIRQFLSTDSKGFANLSEEQKQAIADFVLIKDNGKRSEIGSKILSGELLLLPPNLCIWATMNTSDQSLFPIDSAFKRRWNWHYVPIEYDKKDWLLHIGDNYYRWGDFLKAINPIISELTESADKQIGYFFAKPDEKHGETTENNTISEDVFINKVLFYLWTDVLKDFDAGKEPFLNPDTKRAYEFSDFFDSEHDYLEQLVGKLGLEAVAIDFDSIPDDDSDEDETTSADATQRDHSRYSINGEGKYNKRQTVLRALRKYVEANPSMTSEEVIENWKKVNPEIPYFILSAPEYDTRIKEYPAQRNRYWSVKTGTDEKVYITNQWGAGRIAEFINLINNSNFGLHIEKVTE